MDALSKPSKTSCFFPEPFVCWKDCVGSGTRRGCKSRSTGMFLKWGCMCRQGLESLWTEMNHAHLRGSSANTQLCLFRVLATALSLFPDFLDSSAMAPHFPAIIYVPCFYWFLHSRDCWSEAFILPISQGHLWLVLEGLQGADKWECCLPASTHTMQKRFSASAGHVPACSGSFVLVTFSQLNENPPQRLMQPGAIWEVQAHLLRSLSHLPTILQSWQEGNKGSRTWIAVRSSFTRRGVCSPLTRYPIFLWLCLDLSSPHLSPSFLDPLFCMKMRAFLSSSACSSNLSHSCQECVDLCFLQSPLVCPAVPSPLCSGLQPCLLPVLESLCISSSAPKGLEFLWRGQCIRKSLTPKLAFIWFGFILLEMWLVHPYYLFSSLQLISGNFLNNISELRLVSAGWF